MSPRRSYRGRSITPRLKQVAQLLGQGLSNRQIGKKFGIADYTAKEHIRHLREIYRCTTRQLIVRFAREGLRGTSS